MRSFTVAKSLAVGMVLGVLVSAPSVAHAQHEFVLIANRANPVSTLTRDEASKLFLMKRSKWSSGQNAQPIDQSESSPVRRRFSDAIHRMDVPSVKSFWQEIVFSGKGEPPPEGTSDASIIAYVRANPNALGYVGAATAVVGVKIIAVTR